MGIIKPFLHLLWNYYLAVGGKIVNYLIKYMWLLLTIIFLIFFKKNIIKFTRSNVSFFSIWNMFEY